MKEGQIRIPSGYAISGLIDKTGKRMSGEAIIRSISVMHDRSNGLGGGFAAYGIYPKTYHPNYEHLLSLRFQEILNDPGSPVIPLIDRKKAFLFSKSSPERGKPWFGQLMAGPQLMAYFIQLNYWLEKYA